MQRCTRRRSPNITATLKEIDRCPPSSLTLYHQRPWNKYGTSEPVMRCHAVLSRPTKTEFLRIAHWSIEKRKFEERQAELLRQKTAIIEKQKLDFIEATRSLKRSTVMQDIQQRRCRREAMKRERCEAQERYLEFLRNLRQAPLLYEIRATDFERALEKMEATRMELYKTKMRPFKTIRPREIIATSILKELGKHDCIEENQIPFEMPITKRCLNVSSCLRHPSLTVDGKNPGTAKDRLEASAHVETGNASQDRQGREDVPDVKDSMASVSKAQKETGEATAKSGEATANTDSKPTAKSGDSLSTANTDSKPTAKSGDSLSTANTDSEATAKPEDSEDVVKSCTVPESVEGINVASGGVEVSDAVLTNDSGDSTGIEPSSLHKTSIDSLQEVSKQTDTRDVTSQNIEDRDGH